jgi:hypothetical protein
MSLIKDSVNLAVLKFFLIIFGPFILLLAYIICFILDMFNALSILNTTFGYFLFYIFVCFLILIIFIILIFIRIKTPSKDKIIIEDRQFSKRTLSINGADFLELQTESNKNFDFSIGIRNNKIGKYIEGKIGSRMINGDVIFSFWPFIDSPLSDYPETIWEKDISELSDFSNSQFMFFSNKPEKAKKLFMSINKYPDDFDLFYLSQNSFFSYYKITDNITKEKVDEYITNFVNLVGEIEKAPI